MSANYEFWNVLHDGEIVAISRSAAGSVVMTVEIEYLTNLLPTDSNCIRCHLMDCDTFSMNIWEDGKVTDELERIAQLKCEILSTESESMPVQVITTLGEIHARYSGVLFTMTNGEELPFDALCAACETYWNKWQKDAGHEELDTLPFRKKVVRLEPAHFVLRLEIMVLPKSVFK